MVRLLIPVCLFFMFIVCLHPAMTEAAEQTIGLEPGYNFVSARVATDSPLSMTRLMNDDSAITQVFRFDVTGQKFIFLLRIADGSLFGTPFEFTGGAGVIFNCAATTSIQLTGTEFTTDPMADLSIGFNLVSMHLRDGMSAMDLLTNHPELDSVYHWSQQDNNFKFVISLQDGSLFGEDIQIQAGRAYFLKRRETNPQSDLMAPRVECYLPGVGSAGFRPTDPLSIIFNENIARGSTGSVMILRVGSDDIVDSIPISSAKITMNGATLTIEHAALAELVQYCVLIDPGAILDEAGNPFPGIVAPSAWSLTTADVTPPMLTDRSPAHGMTTASLTLPLVLTFSEPVRKGEEGSITFLRSMDGSTAEVITITSASVTVTRTEVRITHVDFDGQTGYAVLIDPGALLDMVGNPFEGIPHNPSWNFATVDSLAPAIVELTPVDNGMAGSRTANLRIQFDREVVAGTTGVINIRKTADGSIVQSISIDSGLVMVSGRDVVIAHLPLLQGTGYCVTIDGGCFRGLDGRDFPGLNDRTTWNFTTPLPSGMDAIPTVLSVTTDTSDGVYGIGQVIPIQIHFSEPVTVLGKPRIPLNAAEGAFAIFIDGGNTDSLHFQYVVEAGHASADLDLGGSSIDLNGALIRDSADQDARLVLPALPYLAATHAIVVSSTAPTAPLVEGITSGTFSSTQTFIVVGEAGSLIEYTLDNGANWLTFTGVVHLDTDGSYTVIARQTTAGQASANSIPRVVTIDTAVPLPPMISGILPGQHKTTQQFSLAGETGAFLEYSLNGGNNWLPYLSPVSITDDGIHVILARQHDRAGNDSAVSDPFSFTIDSNLHDAPVLDGVRPGMYNTTQQLTVTGAPGATVEISLNGGVNWLNFTGPVSLNGEGEYTILLRQTTADGIPSSISEATTLIIDKTPPPPPVITGVTAGVYTTPRSFTCQGEADASVEFSIDGGRNWNPYHGPVAVRVEGNHELLARQRDRAGNLSPDSETIVFTYAAWTLTYQTDGNGVIGGPASQHVISGANGMTVTAIPNEGYHFNGWSDGVSSQLTTRTETGVVEDRTVIARFALNGYTLTYRSGEHGAVSGDLSQTVDHGASGSPVLATADPGYHFAQWTDGSTTNPRTDAGVSSLLDVRALFEANNSRIIISNAGGPVAAATVVVDGNDFLSDSDGVVLLALPPGDYPFSVLLQGYTPHEETLTIPATSNLVHRITLNAGTMHTLTINTFFNGWDYSPVDGATVELAGIATSSPGGSTHTFQVTDGSYRYQALYSLNGTDLDASGTVEVSGSDTSTIAAMHYTLFPVTLIITDGSNPVAGATVDMDKGNVIAVTGPDGQVVFPEYSPSNGFGFLVDLPGHPGFGGSILDATRERNEFEVVIPYRVTFRVTDATDTPIAGADVKIANMYPAFQTNSSGEVTVQWPNNRPTEFGVHKLLHGSVTGTLTLEGADLTLPVTLPNLALKSVTLQARDGHAGGDPLPDVSLFVFDENQQMTTATTDAAGTARFSLSDGSYTFRSEIPGRYDEHGSIVVIEPATTVEIILRNASHAIDFHVYGAGTHTKEVTVNGVTKSTLNGDVLFDLQDGTYNWTATAPGYQDASGTVTVSRFARPVYVWMKSMPVYPVSFSFTDGTSSVFDIALTLDATDHSIRGGWTRNLGDGSHPYRVEVVGYDVIVGTVEVAGAAVDVPIVLSPCITHEFAITVRSEFDASLMEGAIVVLSGGFVGTTDAAGQKRFTVPQGTFIYDVTAPDRIHVTGEVLLDGDFSMTAYLDFTSHPVHFLVLDDAPGANPIAGADVTLEGQTLTTDAQGRASFTRKVGSYPFSISGAGHVTRTGQLQTVGEEMTKSVILPSMQSSFQVLVTDGTDPIPDATVDLGGATATTDGNGTAAFDLPDGATPYSVTGHGYSASTGEVVLPGSGLLQVELQRNFHRANIVLLLEDYTEYFADTHSITLDGVTRTYMGIDYDRGEQVTTTLLLESGVHDLIVQTRNFLPAAQQITVDADNQDYRFVLTGLTSSVSIQVTDGSSPLPGAEVVISGERGQHSVTTGADGKATFDALNTYSAYSYTITAVGFGSKTGTFRCHSRPDYSWWFIVALPMEPISLSVAHGATALADVSLTLTSASQAQFSATSDAEGRAVFQLPGLGEYACTAQLGGYLDSTCSILIDGSQFVFPVNMEPVRHHVVFRTVEGSNPYYAGDSAKPVPGGDFIFIHPLEAPTPSTESAITSCLCRPGSLGYTIDAEGFERVSDTVDVAGDTTIEVAMTPLEQLASIVVKGADGMPLEGVAVSCNGISQTTGPFGQVTLNIPAGSYPFTIAKYGWDTLETTLTVLMGNEGNRFNLGLGKSNYPVAFSLSGEGEPMEGVTVAVDRSGVRTDASGIAQFHLDHGEHAFEVDHFAHELLRGTFEVTSPLSRDLALTKSTYSLTIIVQREGAGIGGAEVTLDGQTSQTDAGGAATFPVHHGTHPYSVSLALHRTTTGEVRVEDGDTTRIIQVVGNPPPPFRVMEGTTPLEGVLVEESWSTDHESLQTITTGPSGTAAFSTSMLPPEHGRTYLFSKYRYDPAQVAMDDLSGQDTVTVQLEKTRFSIIFTALYGDQAIAGTTIRLSGGGPLPLDPRRVVEGLLDGVYPYTCSIPGFEDVAGNVTIDQGDRSIAIPLTPVAYTAAVMVREGNSPIAGASVTMDGRTVITDQQGRAPFELTYGQHEFQVRKEGVNEFRDALTVVAGNLTAEATISSILYPVRISRENTAGSSGSQFVDGVSVTIGDQTRVTGSSGSAHFSLPYGDYAFTTSEEDFLPYAGNFSIDPDNELITVTITDAMLVQRTYAVEFAVTDQSSALSGVPVIMAGQQLITDGAGMAVFSFVKGVYNWSVEEPDFFPASGSIVLPGDEGARPLALVKRPAGPSVTSIDTSADGYSLVLSFDKMIARLQPLSLLAVLSDSEPVSVSSHTIDPGAVRVRLSLEQRIRNGSSEVTLSAPIRFFESPGGGQSAPFSDAPVANAIHPSARADRMLRDGVAPDEVFVALRQDFSCTALEAARIMLQAGFAMDDPNPAVSLSYQVQHFNGMAATELPGQLLACGFTMPVVVDALYRKHPAYWQANMPLESQYAQLAAGLKEASFSVEDICLALKSHPTPISLADAAVILEAAGTPCATAARVLLAEFNSGDQGQEDADLASALLGAGYPFNEIVLTIKALRGYDNAGALDIARTLESTDQGEGSVLGYLKASYGEMADGGTATAMRDGGLALSTIIQLLKANYGTESPGIARALESVYDFTTICSALKVQLLGGSPVELARTIRQAGLENHSGRDLFSYLINLTPDLSSTPHQRATVIKWLREAGYTAEEAFLAEWKAYGGHLRSLTDQFNQHLISSMVNYGYTPDEIYRSLKGAGYRPDLIGRWMLWDSYYTSFEFDPVKSSMIGSGCTPHQLFAAMDHLNLPMQGLNELIRTAAEEMASPLNELPGGIIYRLFRDRRSSTGGYPDMFRALVAFYPRADVYSFMRDHGGWTLDHYTSMTSQQYPVSSAYGLSVTEEVGLLATFFQVNKEDCHRFLVTRYKEDAKDFATTLLPQHYSIGSQAELFALLWGDGRNYYWRNFQHYVAGELAGQDTATILATLEGAGFSQSFILDIFYEMFQEDGALARLKAHGMTATELGLRLKEGSQRRFPNELRSVIGKLKRTGYGGPEILEALRLISGFTDPMVLINHLVEFGAFQLQEATQFVTDSLAQERATFLRLLVTAWRSQGYIPLSVVKRLWFDHQLTDPVMLAGSMIDGGYSRQDIIGGVVSLHISWMTEADNIRGYYSTIDAFRILATMEGGYFGSTTRQASVYAATHLQLRAGKIIATMHALGYGIDEMIPVMKDGHLQLDALAAMKAMKDSGIFDLEAVKEQIYLAYGITDPIVELMVLAGGVKAARDEVLVELYGYSDRDGSDRNEIARLLWRGFPDSQEEIRVLLARGGNWYDSFADIYTEISIDVFNQRDPVALYWLLKRHQSNLNLIGYTHDWLARRFPALSYTERLITLADSGFTGSQVYYFLNMHQFSYGVPDGIHDLLRSRLGCSADEAVSLLYQRLSCADCLALLLSRGYSREEVVGPLLDRYYRGGPTAAFYEQRYNTLMVLKAAGFSIMELADGVRSLGSFNLYTLMRDLYRAGFTDVGQLAMMLHASGFPPKDIAYLLYELHLEERWLNIPWNDSDCALAAMQAGVTFLQLAQGHGGSRLNDTHGYRMINSQAGVVATYLNQSEGMNVRGEDLTFITLREVGWSAGRMAELNKNLGIDWKSAIINLIIAGYGSGSAWEAVWNNDSYHNVIGAEIIFTMITSPLSSVTVPARVYQVITWGSRIRKAILIIKWLADGPEIPNI